MPILAKNITLLCFLFCAIQAFSQPVEDKITQLSEVVVVSQSPVKQVQKNSLQRRSYRSATTAQPQ